MFHDYSLVYTLFLSYIQHNLHIIAQPWDHQAENVYSNITASKHL